MIALIRSSYGLLAGQRMIQITPRVAKQLSNWDKPCDLHVVRSPVRAERKISDCVSAIPKVSLDIVK